MLTSVFLKYLQGLPENASPTAIRENEGLHPIFKGQVVWSHMETEPSVSIV
jgi:hypothetical protein